MESSNKIGWGKASRETATGFSISGGATSGREQRLGLCALRHGIQISMEAILTCHPARSTEWLHCHPKSCELWRIRTGPITLRCTTDDYFRVVCVSVWTKYSSLGVMESRSLPPNLCVQKPSMAILQLFCSSEHMQVFFLSQAPGVIHSPNFRTPTQLFFFLFFFFCRLCLDEVY